MGREGNKNDSSLVGGEKKEQLVPSLGRERKRAARRFLSGRVNKKRGVGGSIPGGERKKKFFK